MFSRCFRLAVAGATVLAGLALATPAAASVTYDPATKTGFVGTTEVRKAFGWTAATLAARASAVVFDHEFWTDDTYAASCGERVVPIVHRRQFGSLTLADAIAHGERGASVGYRGKVTGFRLTGARFGISGTSLPPVVGQPCPQARGESIDQVRLVSSTTGWALAARFGDVRGELLRDPSARFCTRRCPGTMVPGHRTLS